MLNHNEILKQIIAQYGPSELAKRTGLSRRTIQYINAGKEPMLSNAMKIFEIGGYRLEKVYEDTCN